MTTKAQIMTNTDTQQRNRLIISVIVVVAVVAVLAVILLSGGNSVVTTDYSTFHQERLADGGFVIGNPDAKVTLVEFADYDCPACHTYLSTMDKFFDEYVKTGKAKFEYRIFPTHGGQVTAFIGNLVECFDEQKPGSFWTAKDLLYQSAMRGSYNDSTARTVASQLGLDYTKALSCSSSANRVNADVVFGQSLGVQSTPAVLVRYGHSTPQFITYNGQTFNRGGAPYEAIQAAVAAG